MDYILNKYFDNGSTSYPKPREVRDAMSTFLADNGGSYGRASYHAAYTTTHLVEECRDLMGKILGAKDGENIAWAHNATHAANIIINSLELKGKKVLVSPLEHNSITRPLMAAGADVVIMPHLEDGYIDLETLTENLHSMTHEEIALIIINHQSNVNGVIQPINEIYNIADSIPVMVDTAQSLGNIPYSVEFCDYATFTGHKGLLGPTGIGGFYARDISTIKPLVYGGTGSNSASFDMPKAFPECVEAGTLNNVGIMGLKAALECNVSYNHTFDDYMHFMTEVAKIRGIEVFCAKEMKHQGRLFSFRHSAIDGADITHRLESDYGIACRFGLHCAALAHKTLNTTESGLIRVATSRYHTVRDFQYFIEALSKTV